MKHGKFKKITAIGLALTMAVGLIYSSNVVKASGINNTRIETEGLETSKNVVWDEASGKYKITLESYATGQVTPGERTPADIVLLLDMSGSMTENIGSGYKYTPIFEDDLKTNKDYYIRDDSEYKRVSYNNRQDSWGYFSWSGWNSVYPKRYENDGNRTQFYQREEVDQVSRIKALKTAANSFIDSIAKQNTEISDPSKKDRISIVKYAGQEYDSTGNDTHDERPPGSWFGSEEVNYSQIVKNLTYVNEAGTDQLKTSIESLDPKGQTRTDNGLNRAKVALKEARPEAAKYVILFTDGEPSEWSDWSNNVAVNAINKAKDIKNAGTKLFTINVMDDANPNDTSSNMNKFMNAVSSNYPYASASGDFRVDLGSGSTKNGYYLKASDEQSLIDAFERISEDIGGSKIDLDSNAVLVDSIEESFNLPSGYGDNQIKVYTQKYNGNGKWGSKLEHPEYYCNIS